MTRVSAAIVTSVLLCLSGCSEPSNDSAAIPSAEPFDKGVTRERAVAELREQTFEEVGNTETCTEDCGGHNAGFDWAKDHNITDEAECDGNSQSFVEGCQTYARAVEGAVDEELGGSDEDESAES